MADWLRLIVVRSIVWFDGGLWCGECVDLSLCVQSVSLSGVEDKLVSAISGYLQTALKGDTCGLVPRPSAWHRRLLWHAIALACLLPRRGYRRYLTTFIAEVDLHG